MKKWAYPSHDKFFGVLIQGLKPSIRSSMRIRDWIVEVEWLLRLGVGWTRFFRRARRIRLSGTVAGRFEEGEARVDSREGHGTGRRYVQRLPEGEAVGQPTSEDDEHEAADATG